MKAFFAELTKRKVIKVALVYIVAGWIMMQVADVMFPALGLPEWTITLVAALLIIGFPVALVLSWAFEITPEGLKREKSGDSASGEDSESAPPLNSTREKSVAVLPFIDLSQEGDHEYFSDGLTEELLNVLSQIPALKVSSRTSSFAFKGVTHDIPAVAAKLNVAYVVEGSVRKAAGRLRVTAQLIEVATDTHMWSQNYDRDLGDIFAIQDDIAREIVGALQVRLMPEDLPEATTENVEAYDFYLRGRSMFHRLGAKNIDKAVELFRRATEIDPEFARGWAGLALSLASRQILFSGTPEDTKAAEEASLKAIELGPDVAETHTARIVAAVARSKYDEAEQSFNRAVSLNPMEFEAYYQFGRVQWKNGNLDRAIELFEKALEVNPDDYQSPILLMSIYRGRGDMKKAREAAIAGARAAAANIEVNPDNSRAYALGAGALLIAGDKERAFQWIDTALRLNPGSEDTQYNAACLYVEAGELEKAMDCLEHGLHDPDWMDHDPDLDPLRDHPRFKALMKKRRDGA